MTIDEYQTEAQRTHLSLEQIVKSQHRFAPLQQLLHAQLGISSESGELADSLKKHIVYGFPLDGNNVVEELGDLLWYISLACDAMEISMEEVMSMNINKLRIRYPEKFTEQLAKERLDKQPKHVCILCGEIGHKTLDCPQQGVI